MSDATSPHFLPILDAHVREAVGRRCRGWLRAHADDISQATRLRLLGYAWQRPRAVLTPAYVRRAAHNAVTDAVRRHGRREALWSVHGEAVASRPAPRDPERALLDHELAAAVHEMVQRLPPARREVVALYLEGRGITEIAEQLGRPRKQIDNHVYRGLSTLRRELVARGLGPASVAA